MREWKIYFLESEELGLRGRVDALRTRDKLFLTSISGVVPVETRTISRRRSKARIILAYAYLIESSLGIVKEGRIRYHADNVLVHVPLDDEGTSRSRCNSTSAIAQGNLYSPVTDNERLCALLLAQCVEADSPITEWQPIRLFPKMTKAGDSCAGTGLL